MPGGPREIEPEMSARGLRVAIVVSVYNAGVTQRLKEGAIAEHKRLGGEERDLVVLSAPGSFELPVLARAAVMSGCDAVVALGCVIRGETRHDQVIADAIARGLMEVSTATGAPVAFGVLTVENAAQAEARSQPVDRGGGGRATGGEKAPVENKGVEAMAAAVHAANVIRRLKESRPVDRREART